MEETSLVHHDPACQSSHHHSVIRVYSSRDLAAFPEGQRSPNGQLGPFKDGMFILAVEVRSACMACQLLPHLMRYVHSLYCHYQTGAPVVPVAIGGADHM